MKVSVATTKEITITLTEAEAKWLHDKVNTSHICSNQEDQYRASLTDSLRVALFS